MYGLSICSKGSEMFKPMFSPAASEAPRFAASMIPGPPPEQTTKRRSVPSSPFDQCVSRAANSRVSS